MHFKLSYNIKKDVIVHNTNHCEILYIKPAERFGLQRPTKCHSIPLKQNVQTLL